MTGCNVFSAFGKKTVSLVSVMYMQTFTPQLLAWARSLDSLHSTWSPKQQTQPQRLLSHEKK